MYARSNLEATIQEILDMGGGSWDRETVILALRAAFNNPERAVEYLYSGIPLVAQGPAPQLAPTPSGDSGLPNANQQYPLYYGIPLIAQGPAPQLSPTPSGGGGIPNTNQQYLFHYDISLVVQGSVPQLALASGGGGRLPNANQYYPFYYGIPQVAQGPAPQLSSAPSYGGGLPNTNQQYPFHYYQGIPLVVQGPAPQLPPVPGGGGGLPNANQQYSFHYGPPIMASNAGTGNLDSLRNDQQFQALQANPQIRNMPGQLASATPQAVTVTPEERQAIARLQAMRFDPALVLEVYFACNKNEELAANYLLDHMHEFDE